MEVGGSRVGPLNSVASVYLFSLTLSLFFFQSGIFSVLTPLPQMFCYLRLGRWAGISMPFLIFVVMSFVGSGIGLSYLLQFAIPGVVLSESIIKRYSVEKSFLLALSATVTAIMLFLSLYASGQGLDISELVKSGVQGIVDQVIAFNEGTGGTEEHLREFKKVAPLAVEGIARIYYSLITIIVMFMLWCNILGLSRILKRVGGTLPFGDLSKWRAPEYFVWGVIAGGVVLFAGVDSLVLLAVNLLLVLFVAYFFQGMAIVSCFLNRKELSGFLRGTVYAFIFVMWYLAIVVAVIGLFDLWFDFRKLDSPQEVE